MDLIDSVDFFEQQLNAIRRGAIDRQANEVWANGKLTMLAIDEDREHDLLGAAKISDLGESGSDSTPRLKDIVNQQDLRAIDFEPYFSGSNHGLRPIWTKVISIQRDIQHPQRRPKPLRFQAGLQALCDHITPSMDADNGPRIVRTVRGKPLEERVQFRLSSLLVVENSHYAHFHPRTMVFRAQLCFVPNCDSGPISAPPARFGTQPVPTGSGGRPRSRCVLLTRFPTSSQGRA